MQLRRRDSQGVSLRGSWCDPVRTGATSEPSPARRSYGNGSRSGTFGPAPGACPGLPSGLSRAQPAAQTHEEKAMTTHGATGIVVGIEGTVASQGALEWAIREAAMRECELTVVHAWDYVPARDAGRMSEHEERTASDCMLDAAVASAIRAAGVSPVVSVRSVRDSAAKYCCSRPSSPSCWCWGAGTGAAPLMSFGIPSRPNASVGQCARWWSFPTSRLPCMHMPLARFPMLVQARSRSLRGRLEHEPDQRFQRQPMR